VGFATHNASNVDEAIEMATTFKREGQYDWFRGQVETWPPYSSSFRIGLKGEDGWGKRVENRLINFFSWLQITAGLEAIAKDRDCAFAVAQHYGIPTHYLDFTTDPSVAGYFACDTKSPRPGVESCIYCLDTSNLRDLWASIRTVMMNDGIEVPELEFVSIKVPNLWRMEAQKGVFLYCPTNWDVNYPLDRIVFPYAGYPASPTSGDIYPTRKSQLEILLDQYFMEERLRTEAYKTVSALVASKYPNAHFINQRQPPEKTHARYFVGGTVPRLDSWSSEKLGPWLRVPTNELAELKESTIRLSIGQDLQTRARVAAGMRRRLVENPKIREQNLTWVLTTTHRSDRDHDHGLIQALDWLWGGMRSLPYSDADLAEAVANCIALHQLGFSPDIFVEDAQRIASHVFGSDVIHVEFGSSDGSYSQGFAPKLELEGAVRGDITSKLSPEHADQMKGSVYRLLQAIFAPERIFEFEKLIAIFAHYLIPTQVLSRTGAAVFFSPARLDAFGLP
jgi:hypothetical protein